MTIQEAIKTDKPFRRIGRNFWLMSHRGLLKMNEQNSGIPIRLDVDDILADDWETKP